MRKTPTRAIYAFGAACSALAMATPSAAQERNAANASTSDGPATKIEDIVVTAQRRAENLQKVPITVSAVTSATLATKGVTKTDDLAIAVPGISVVRQNTSTQFFIRGVGTDGLAAGQESAIATFIDGVYQSSMSGATFGLNNIERIEVLKGPQGTLYGRNATGGAVNIITRDPSFSPVIKGEVGYGNYDSISGQLYGSTGLTSNIAVDLALAYADQRNGFGRNITTGAEINKRKDFGARGKMLIDLAGTRIVLAGDYAYDKGTFGVAYRAYPPTTLVNGQAGFPAKFYDVQTEATPAGNSWNWGGSAHIEHSFGTSKLTSISAYRGAKVFNRIDADTTPLPLLVVPFTEKDRQFTQEFQWAGGSGADFNWIVGAFYLNGTARYDPFAVTGLVVAPLMATLTYNEQKTTSYAAYGQATSKIFERTHITLGARYTIDRRRLDVDSFLQFADGSLLSSGTRHDHTTFKEPTWRLAVDHGLNDDVMLYASYSRGFKSGVYNLTSSFDPPVRPEKVDAYEVGVKSLLWDKRLRLNIAAFYSDYRDIQLIKVEISNAQLLNAAKARIYGLDADFDIVISDYLSLSGGGEYLHARYRQFPGVPTYTPNAGFPFGNTLVNCALSPALCVGDGKRLIKAPDFTANLAADLHVPLAKGTGALNIAYSFNNGFDWVPSNRLRQGSYGLVNAQMSWTADDKHIHARLWARNLLNKKYYASVVESALGDIASVAAPRTWGATLGFEF